MITAQIIQIVNDAVEFQNTDLCFQLKESRHPPEYWKWVKIHTHRCAGFSTAALMLLEMYTSALIIYPNHNILNHARRQALDEGLCPSVAETLLHRVDRPPLEDHMIAEGRVNDMWFRARRPEQRHQLIILDQASMTESQRRNDMNEFRCRLFGLCDVLVELN